MLKADGDSRGEGNKNDEVKLSSLLIKSGNSGRHCKLNGSKSAPSVNKGCGSLAAVKGKDEYLGHKKRNLNN